MNGIHIKLHALWQAACLQVAKAAPQILVGIVVFIVAWLIAVLAKCFIVRLAKHAKKREYLYHLIGSTVMVMILIGGLVTALGTMGINIGAMVAGVGLAGFAASFAMKDILQNVLSGFLILFYQPFKANDHIVVDTVEGKVTGITLRYTIVKTDEQHTYVPNSLILTKPLTIKDGEAKTPIA